MSEMYTYETLKKRVHEHERDRKVYEGTIQEFEQLFSMALDLICIADIQTAVFLKMNKACKTILGFSEDEMLGRPFFDFIHPDDVEPTRQVVAEKLSLGDMAINFENRYKCKDGTWKWLSWVSRPNSDKGITYAVARDITSEKEARKALEESERRYRSLYENAQAGLARTQTSDGSILECNTQMARIFGYDDAETFIREYAMAENYVDTSQREKFIAELKTAGEIINREVQLYKRDRTTVWVRFDSRMVPEQGYMEDVVIDITEQKKAMVDRLALQDRLDQARRLESVGRLAGGVAHDFNNMLFVIQGYTQAAMEEADPSGPQHAMLAEVLTAARRSANLTKQLLAYARKQTISPRIMDLNTGVEKDLGQIRQILGPQIQLSWQPGRNLPPVNMDPSQVDDILTALGANAAEAIEGAGRVTFHTGVQQFDAADCEADPACLPGRFVRLTVEDDGCGMDEQTLENLFEPFFTTRDVGQGSGLGLAMVDGIVSQNNGFVKVDSTPGRGSIFHVFFPCHAGTTVNP